MEIQKRINDSKPKLIIGGSCGIEVNKIVPYKGKSKYESCVLSKTTFDNR